MARLDFFAFFPARFMGREAVKLMTHAERGVYITLMCHAWENDGLPTSVALLARIVGVSKDEMTEMMDGPLGECWAERDGRLVDMELEEERERAAEKSGAAKKAAEKRWAKKRAPKADADAVQPHSERNAPAVPTQCDRNADADADAVPQDKTRQEHSLTTFESETRVPAVGSRLREVLRKELEPITDDAMELVVRLDAQTREAREGLPGGKSEMGAAAWRKALAMARRDLPRFRACVELTEERSAQNLQEPDKPKGHGSAKPNLGARANLQRENQEAARRILEAEARGEPLPSIFEPGLLTPLPGGPSGRVLDVGGESRPRGHAGGGGQHRAAQAEVAL